MWMCCHATNAHFAIALLHSKLKTTLHRLFVLKVKPHLLVWQLQQGIRGGYAAPCPFNLLFFI